MKKVLVQRRRHYLPHTHFHGIAHDQLRRAANNPKEREDLLLVSLLFSALAFEAYMNFVGSRVESKWPELERLSPIEKLSRIAATLNTSVDFGRRPYRSIKELFKFRNRIVHPQEESLSHEYVTTPEGYRKGERKDLLGLIPRRLAFATEANTTRCVDDVGRVIHCLDDKLEGLGINVSMLGWEDFGAKYVSGDGS